MDEDEEEDDEDTYALGDYNEDDDYGDEGEDEWEFEVLEDDDFLKNYN